MSGCLFEFPLVLKDETKLVMRAIVLGFEEALLKKSFRDGDLAINDEERVVLAVEALEREVNNGG